VPFPQATPMKYTVDRAKCLYFKMLAKGKEGACLLCEKACEAEAINHKMEGEELEISAGSIIVATGFDMIDPKIRTEYGYGVFENVITALEFERMLNAAGPTKGKVARRSDGVVPKKIAFIQCYGSRDVHHGCRYCSRVCCMYAMKEAMLAKEHESSIEDITIYYMDIRAYGKGFEDYYKRSEDDGVIKYFRGRPARIIEDPITKTLTIRAENTETGQSEEHEADLVILSSAIVPSKGTEELAEVMGLKLDDGGFFKEYQSNTSVVETNRKGIFVCGCAQGPKDIPDSVAQASAAAARAEFWVKDNRILDHEAEVSEALDGPDVDTKANTAVDFSEPRIGVFICHCGSNIASVVDVEAVSEYAKKLPNVVYSSHNLYTCSDNTQKDIQEIIKENNLTRVVVSACTPRTHEPIFRETCAKAGLNPYLFEMANIREQCSWIHNQEKDEATKKAKDLVRSAVARAAKLQPLESSELKVGKNALVIGGGVSGMSAAIDLNNLGFQVFLVEEQPFLGGGLADRELLSPEYTPVTEILYQYYRDIEKSNIKVLTNAKIDEVKGFIGNFEIHVCQKGTGVDIEKCNSC